jgi:hypothetical protein
VPPTSAIRAALDAACAGMRQGIIHLGGYSVEGPWEEIHSANIVGLWNTLRGGAGGRA